MLNLLTESIVALQLTVLSAGVASFCAAVLLRAHPLCVWLEWANGCGDGAPQDATQD